MSFLDFLKKKKPEPATVTDTLGTFTIKNTEKDMYYDGEVDWCGKKCSVLLLKDDDGGCAGSLGVLRKLLADDEAWENKLRAAIEENFCKDGLAEIWGGCSEPETPDPIPVGEFMSRISMGFIAVYPDGSLHFDYDCDDMFTDHGISCDTDISCSELFVGLEG